MLRVDNVTQLPATRAAALLQNTHQYFTGQPCRRGHIAPRNYDGNCVACVWQRSADAKRNRTRSGQVRMLLWSAKSRAEKAEVPFDLSAEDVFRIWPKGNTCPVFGTEFTDPRHVTKTNRWLSASLDRIYPQHGYVIGNVAIISVRANTMKHDVTDPAAFRRLADWLEQQRVARIFE